MLSWLSVQSTEAVSLNRMAVLMDDGVVCLVSLVGFTGKSRFQHDTGHNVQNFKAIPELRRIA